MVTASLKDTRVQRLLMGAHQLLYLYSGIYLMTGAAITLRGEGGGGDYAIHNVKHGALGDTRASEIGHCYKVI